MRWLESITNAMDVDLGKLQETVRDQKAWRAAVHGVVKSQTQLSDSTQQAQVKVVFLHNYSFYFYLLIYNLQTGLPWQPPRTVKNLSTMQEIWVQYLGWEDILEKGMATDSSVLAWRIAWTVDPGGLQSMGLQSQT